MCPTQPVSRFAQPRAWATKVKLALGFMASEESSMRRIRAEVKRRPSRTGHKAKESKRSARKLHENIRAALAADRRTDAITTFLTASGAPPEMAAGQA